MSDTDVWINLEFSADQLLEEAGDFEAGFDVVGAEVAVLEVVGVFPDVDAVDQGGAFHDG